MVSQRRSAGDSRGFRTALLKGFVALRPLVSTDPSSKRTPHIWASIPVPFDETRSGAANRSCRRTKESQGEETMTTKILALDSLAPAVSEQAAAGNQTFKLVTDEKPEYPEVD